MSEQYPCPCCGSLSLDEPAGGTYNICPVCSWEDDPVQLREENYAGGANRVSLAEARQNFAKYGISDPTLPSRKAAPSQSDEKNEDSFGNESADESERKED